MIETVDVCEAADILAFMEEIVATSVDAPPESKIVFLGNLRRNVERWAEAPEQSVHLKFVEHGVVLGVVLVRDFWNLCSLFVAPAHHRRGIGSKLFLEAVAICRSKAVAPSIRLNAAHNAVPFYRALGFQEAPPVPGLCHLRAGPVVFPAQHPGLARFPHLVSRVATHLAWFARRTP